MTICDQIISAYNRKGYKFFDIDKSPSYNLNIFGIRSETHTQLDTFDDKLGVIYKNQDSQRICSLSECTTDPGKYWLNHPMNKNGTAILVPGQYIGCWKIGLHQGKYEALVQIKPVKVYRDGDLDNEYDFDSATIEEGIFGINIHRSNPFTESYYVDKWSAGCQVFKKIADFMTFMAVVKKSAITFGNSFTYTLFKESEIL